MGESYSVKAVLSATDSGFTRAMTKAGSAVDSLSSKLKSGLSFGALAAAGSKALNAVTSSISSLTSELSSSSATWKTFQGNMEMNGKTSKQINAVKKDLQEFAQATIYSSSDMASTYAQLSAVGTKNTTKLVKGFGGLASAAEDPAQAMKTLSQQATQMAAKPSVQWQDFKLMLEQTPAGVAAVAKQMGMSTQEMIQAVQDGTVKTEDFFDAVAKVGTNDAFTKMATEYKTVGQAMDGLTETAGNVLQPAFDKLSSSGIKAVSAFVDKLGTINGDALAKKVEPLTTAIDKVTAAFEKNGIGGAVQEIASQIGQSGGLIQQFGAAVGAAFAVTHITDFISVAKSVSGVLGGIKVPEGLAEKLNFSNISKKAIAGMENLKSSFGNIGTAVDTFGSKIAGSFTAITGNVDSGIKIWDKFAGAGNKVTAFGEMLSSGLTSKVSGAITVLQGLGSKVGIILAPFQTVVSGVLGLGGRLASGLASMMGVALQALMPAALVGVVLAGLGVLYTQFGTQIDQIISLAQSKGPAIISGLADSIANAIPGLISSGAQIVTGLLDTITANLPAVISGGTQIITSLVGSVAAAAPSLLSSAASAIGQFAIGIASALPQLITSGMGLLLSLAQGAVAALPTLISSAITAVQSFATGILQNLPQILATAAQLMATLAGGIVKAVPQVIAAIPKVVSAIIKTIMNTDWLAVGKNVISSIGSGFLSGISGLFSGGKKGGKEVSSGTAAGIESSSGKATAAAGNVTENVSAALSSGSSGAKTAGTATGSNYSAGISTGMEKAGTAAEKSTEKVSKTTKKTATSAKTAGKQTGNNYSTALKSGLNKAPSIASSAVSKVNAKLRSGVSGARSAGYQISAGFASGMRSCLGQIQSAANAMVAAADKAIRAKAQIHSPSKLTKGHGKNIAIGLGNGIRAGINTVKKAAKKLTDTVLSTLQKASSTREYEDAASSAVSTYKSKMESQVTKTTKSLKSAVDSAVEKLQKKNVLSDKTINKMKKEGKISEKTAKAMKKSNKALKKAYTNAGKLIKNKLTSAIQKEGTKAINAAEKALTALGEKYQEKYDEIASDRSNYLSKLQDYGDLFTSDDYGYVSLVDFSAQKKQIEQLSANMKKLKSVLPYDLMTDIQDLSTAEGLTYTNELLKMSTAELKAYGKSYTSMMKAAKTASNSYYQSYVDKLDKDYSSEVTKVLSNLKTKMNTIAEQAVSGLTGGLTSKKAKKKLKKAATNLASILVKSIKNKLKIHSPSKVFNSLGGYVGQGFINGIDSMRSGVERAMDGLVMVPQVSTPALAGDFSGALSSEYDYYRSAEYTVVVPVEMDGKEIARVTAPYTEEELNKRQARTNRKKGVR